MAELTWWEAGRKTCLLDGQRVRIEVVDGLAAGGPWIKLKFVGGPYAGKTVNASWPWGEPLEVTIDTRPQTDDGYEINGEDWPGDRVSALDDKVLTLVD